MRTFIKTDVAGGNAYKLKLSSITEKTSRVVVNLDGFCSDMEEVLEKDSKIKNEIDEVLSVSDESNIRPEIQNIVKRMLEIIEKQNQYLIRKFKDELSFLNCVKAAFSSVNIKDSVNALFKEYESDLKHAIEEKSQNVANEFVDNLSDKLRQIIKQLKEAAPKTLSDQLDFSNNLNKKKDDVIKAINSRGEDIIKNKEYQIETDHSILDAKSELAATGAVAGIGVLIASLTNVFWLDCTGGALTIAGLFAAGGAILFKRNKIIGKLEESLNTGYGKFERDIPQELNDKFERIYQQLLELLSPFYSNLEEREKLTKDLREKLEKIKPDLDSIKTLVLQ
jgi:hypothetical protein